MTKKYLHYKINDIVYRKFRQFFIKSMHHYQSVIDLVRAIKDTICNNFRKKSRLFVILKGQKVTLRQRVLPPVPSPFAL